jgi:hypothetical protein
MGRASQRGNVSAIPAGLKQKRFQVAAQDGRTVQRGCWVSEVTREENPIGHPWRQVGSQLAGSATSPDAFQFSIRLRRPFMPFRRRTIRKPQNKVCWRWDAAAAPQQLRTLRPMTVRVQAHLHEGLRDGTSAVWNERAFQNPCKVAFRSRGKPRGLLCLGCRVSLDERIKRR